MRTILVKNPITMDTTRRCLNCGKDISNKRSDAKFCCSMCYESYHGLNYTQTKRDRYLFNT